MTFAGFPYETMAFLGDLRANNDKAWFEAHKTDYQSHYVAPAKAFVIAVGAELAKIAPRVQAEPRVLGSIFRINRDTRFSKDKRPYKDHLDFWFWEGERKQAVSGFFLRVSPDGVGVGVGCHGFDKARLDAYRQAVCAAGAGAALLRVVAAIETEGFKLGGAHYKRPPAGLEPRHAAAGRFLLHNALYVHRDEPAEVATGAVLPICVAHWRLLAPLHRWLIDHVQNV